MEARLVRTFWTWPNAISLFRLLFGAPVTIWLYVNGYQLAWLVFLAFVFTDFLDGFFARRTDSCSKTGIFLDPLADQFLNLPLVWYFYWIATLDFLFPFLLTLREALLLFMKLLSGKSVPAIWTGKLKVCTEYAGITLLLLWSEGYFLGFTAFWVALILAYESLGEYRVIYFSANSLEEK